MENKIPEFLEQKLELQYGVGLKAKIIAGYTKKRQVTIRVNTLKATEKDVEEELAQNNIQYKKITWSDDAYILEGISERDIEKLDFYEYGKIYMQSLSSMIPPLILEPKENTDILDMAAAPGGKTTQIAALTRNNSYITACEMNVIRAERLKYNIEKQGATSVYTLVTDSRKMDSFFSFDSILLDAPCSGSGTLSLQNDSISHFSIKLIEKCKKSQLDLLSKAVEVLKIGHEMVYSTCSILQEENEEIINKVLKNGRVEIVPINLEKYADIPILPTKINGTMCIMPNALYEGFFVAKLKKIK